MTMSVRLPDYAEQYPALDTWFYDLTSGQLSGAGSSAVAAVVLIGLLAGAGAVTLLWRQRDPDGTTTPVGNLAKVVPVIGAVFVLAGCVALAASAPAYLTAEPDAARGQLLEDLSAHPGTYAAVAHQVTLQGTSVAEVCAANPRNRESILCGGTQLGMVQAQVDNDLTTTSVRLLPTLRDDGDDLLLSVDLVTG